MIVDPSILDELEETFGHVIRNRGAVRDAIAAGTSWRRSKLAWDSFGLPLLATFPGALMWLDGLVDAKRSCCRP